MHATTHQVLSDQPFDADVKPFSRRADDTTLLANGNVSTIVRLIGGRYKFGRSAEYARQRPDVQRPRINLASSVTGANQVNRLLCTSGSDHAGVEIIRSIKCLGRAGSKRAAAGINRPTRQPGFKRWIGQQILLTGRQTQISARITHANRRAGRSQPRCCWINREIIQRQINKLRLRLRRIHHRRPDGVQVMPDQHQSCQSSTSGSQCFQIMETISPDPVV